MAQNPAEETIVLQKIQLCQSITRWYISVNTRLKPKFYKLNALVNFFSFTLILVLVVHLTALLPGTVQPPISNKAKHIIWPGHIGSIILYLRLRHCSKLDGSISKLCYLYAPGCGVILHAIAVFSLWSFCNIFYVLPSILSSFVCLFLF